MLGEIRDNVHILNLRCAGTVEDDVYAALSDRFGDIFSILGQLPGAFEAGGQNALHERERHDFFGMPAGVVSATMRTRLS